MLPGEFLDIKPGEDIGGHPELDTGVPGLLLPGPIIGSVKVLWQISIIISYNMLN